VHLATRHRDQRHHARSEALFYYFRLEDQLPENYLLRLIDKHISFEFVRERLRSSYSDSGRPSIDPELLLRILLIGYLYGISSERKLVEELRMHLAWRWFTGLGFDQEIPHHSTFSKNRHGRFQESKLFEELFEQIVRQCVEVGLVQGQHLSVDGSFVEANAAKESRIPREQLAEAAQVNRSVRQYLVELEETNPVAEPVHEQDQVSTTDPDSTYATKGGTPARFGYYDNYLVDNHSCVIVGVQATAARMSQETVAAQDMLIRFAQWQGRTPGAENDDHNPPRIAPRHLFDIAVGDDNIFRGDKYKWSFRVTAINVTNKVALYNFLSTFSGTHFLTPRTYTAELGFHF
jgi:transposase